MEASGGQSAILEVTSEAKKISNSNLNKFESYNNSNDSSTMENDAALQSPSAESISTFQELDKVSDLLMDVGQDIVSRVDNPQKVVEPWGTYVSFRIRTKCARWDQDEKEYIVRRRYNDFMALRDRLVESHLQVIPPLPSRHTLLAQLDRYSKDFVLQRMGLLNIFIKRLVTHSILTHSKDLKVFLTATPVELSRHFKSHSGYLSTLTDSLHSLTLSTASTLNPTNLTNTSIYSSSSLSTHNSCKLKDPEFTATSEYMSHLREKLHTLAMISSRINKERGDLASEMQALGPILDSWSQIERFNTDTLSKNSKSSTIVSSVRIDNGNKLMNNLHVDNEDTLGETLKKMVKPLSVISAEQELMVKSYPYAVGNPVKEYTLYVDAVCEKLKHRDGLQASFENAQDKASRKRQDTSTSYGGRAAGKEVEDCHDRLQCASEALRSDLCSWQRQKRTDMKVILSEMARKHINLNEKSLGSWESVLNKTEAQSVSNGTRNDRMNFKSDDLIRQMTEALQDHLDADDVANMTNGQEEIFVNK